MKIYTRGGDGGETGLLGGDRVPKSDPRVDAYGTVDELNASLGLALALDQGGLLDPGGLLDREAVEQIQGDLFALGARLAAADPARERTRGTIPELGVPRIEALERWIDRLDAGLPPLDAFVLPGGSPVGAQLHAARTVCRRAERAVVRLLETQPELDEVIVPYLNRLSDLLFTLARSVNRAAGTSESRWAPQRERRAEESQREARAGELQREVPADEPGREERSR